MNKETTARYPCTRDRDVSLFVCANWKCLEFVVRVRLPLRDREALQLASQPAITPSPKRKKKLKSHVPAPSATKWHHAGRESRAAYLPIRNTDVCVS